MFGGVGLAEDTGKLIYFLIQVKLAPCFRAFKWGAVFVVTLCQFNGTHPKPTEVAVNCFDWTLVRHYGFFISLLVGMQVMSSVQILWGILTWIYIVKEQLVRSMTLSQMHLPADLIEMNLHHAWQQKTLCTSVLLTYSVLTEVLKCFC